MSKLITFFLVVFIGVTILASVMAGGGGIVATKLTAAINDIDTVLPVDSTEGYLEEDYLVIGDEKIFYNWIDDTNFGRIADPCTRGYDGTSAEAHADESMVYTEGASVVNNALGFNVAATSDAMGIWAVVTIPWNFLTKTIPRMISINWTFLGNDMAIIGYFFFAMGAGLVITIALSLAGGRRV